MTITATGAWPTVEFSYDGPLTAADVETFQAVLLRAMRRAEPFAIVVARQPDGPPDDRGLAKSQMRFVQSHAEELARLHAGMAYVRAADEPPGRTRVADRLPYPTQSFDILAQAREWAEQRTTGAG